MCIHTLADSGLLYIRGVPEGFPGVSGNPFGFYILHETLRK